MSDERLSNLESRMASVQTTLEHHSEKHENLEITLKEIGVDVKSLLLHNAEKSGKTKALKNGVIMIGAVISGLIGFLGLILSYLHP